ncbi:MULTISPECIES: LuxR C-terminal-related transcriptional regulator [Vibrio]|uniref:LuxR C-terminal-related transcriptional regulator n=1 Tax=Vibrio qingdaonensis TaxID=2829491 RepID=A0A9X3CRH7_9VIBR|nr:LuxR C-terminal-related transcriptional regulator [Vibrio qingdaonensis]MCW8347739.1 LuxR C-terminal-related transcriptional regulator [Vibrio qingdaonensis]
MRKNSYKRIIQHVALSTSSPDPLVEQLSKLSINAIDVIQPEALMVARDKVRNRILLFDYHASLDIFQQVLNLPLVSKHFETILINVPHRLTTETILRYGNIKGLFYSHESPEKIVKGFDEIINGKNWLPRDVSSQLLHHYRHVVSANTSPAVVDLTAREIDILRSLQSGATNMQMAEDLFITESTVKSHLYQIFRKLSVKNRLQAIAWANQHLLS